MSSKVKYLFKLKKYFRGGITKVDGRNNQGRITVFHRGGGRARKYRQITWFNINSYFFKFFYFYRFTKFYSFFFFKKITCEFDSFRHLTVFLMQDLRWGGLFYKIVPRSILKVFLEPNYYVHSNNFKNLNFSVLYGTFLRDIKRGSLVKNVENFFLGGSVYGRSEGSYCLIRRKLLQYTLLQLPSKKMVVVSSFFRANLCFIRRKDQDFRRPHPKKAGYWRWLGFRPVVCGRAMNPVDHPHGGKSGRGRAPVTPWGFFTKWSSTRSRQKQIFEQKLMKKVFRGKI